MKKITEYPKELVSNRNQIEALFVFCLWKNPELYGDYEIVADRDFLTHDAKFYYSLGYELYKKGYKSFDDASIYSYIDDKETLKEGFNRRGGYRTVEELKSIVNDENVDMYYDELIKSNILLSLYDKGFNVIDELSTYQKMTTAQLYDYLEYQLNNVFLNRGTTLEIQDLDINDKFIEDCDAGLEMGLSFGSTCSLLNYHTLGLHRGSVQIFAGFSGTGKSSFVVHSYVMPVLDQNEKIVIIANEMNKRAWQHIFVATILSQKLDYYGLPRKKLKMGNFTKEQKEMLYKAKEYYEKHYKGRIKFVKIFDYSIDEVKKIIKKLSKQGFKYVVYDTFKPENSSSATVTGDLIEASKQLLQLAEKEDVCIIITMQLAIYMENTRYLTAATLANAKGVKEVVSELVLMRPVWDDEFPDEKYDIKPFRFKKDPLTGKYTNIKEPITLDPDKKYRILFLDKTRNDEGEIALVYKFDGAWNKWVELGYCKPKHQR